MPSLHHVIDLFDVVLACLRIAATHNVAVLWWSVVVGAVLAALCWFGCSQYTRLWNRRFRATVTHHALCAAVMVVTFLATVIYAGLPFLGGYAALRVQLWRAEILLDKTWQERTFSRAYHDVQALGLEDFRDFSLSGGRIPTQSPRSRDLVAARYAGEAVADFRRRSPWLASLLQPSTLNPEERLRADMNAFFARNPGDTYALDPAVGLVARLITDDLVQQAPRVVTLGRIALVALFVAAQLVPLTLIGYAAYSDIKQYT